KEWDKITVPLEDAQKLITNGLPLNEKVYVTDPEFQSSVGEQLWVDVGHISHSCSHYLFYYGKRRSRKVRASNNKDG
ncbi:hypothetical protein PYL81_21630, partial [Paenibacillus larvae subsp. larvae]|nr:hypothetical protein [Paenibacillus larvae subsp. larvae]